GAFHPPVAAEILAMAVRVFIAIGLIVFFVVADYVARREAIVGGQEVDRRPWPAMAPVEDLRRTHQPPAQLAAQAGLAAPEAPYAVAELIVPLCEAGRMVAELVAVGAHIPWL